MTQTLDKIQVFRHLRERPQGVAPAELDALFQQLQPVSFDDLLGGRWKGGVFQTGHKAIQWLEEIKWYGKQFNSHLDVKPLLCRGDNHEIHSHQQEGDASLWKVQFRGMVSAAMVYDNIPIVDHFRLVDWKTVMGIMTGKHKLVCDNGKYCYFYLERDSDTGCGDGL